MHYFGVPTCPYCKKRVNLIRVWSLKRQGEYQCPRCGGISNIFLSPLIHVFAVLAVFSGGALYFFHKFILDDIALKTVVQILIPFALFFLISLFMVYLAKPVIKKVSRAEMKNRNRSSKSFEQRRPAAVSSSQMLYDPDEYIPKTDYRTGPVAGLADDRDMKVVQNQPRRVNYSDEMQKTSVVQIPAEHRAVNAQQAAAPRVAKPVSVPRPVQPRPTPNIQPVQRPVRANPAEAARHAVSSSNERAQTAVRTPRTATSVNAPSVTDDFFAKYDDPDYVERRLREIKEQRGE